MKYIALFFIFLSGFAKASPTYFEVGLEHYTSPIPQSQLLFSDYLFLKIDRSAEHKLGSFSFNYQLLGEYFVDKNHVFYYNIPELYLSYNYRFNQDYFGIKSFSVSLGRKIHPWSFADDYWEFGLWNPLNRWNPLHPQPNGLIGTFFSLQGKDWSLDMLIGGVYLPSTGPSLIIEEGKGRPQSRWAAQIPNKVAYSQILMDINYLEMPDPFLLDILFQQSYILNYKTWLTKERNFWTKFVVAYKPVNDVYLVINEENDIRIDHIEKQITALPLKQKIISSEWGIDYKQLSAIFAVGRTSISEDRSTPAGFGFLHDRSSFAYLSTFVRYNITSNHYVQLSYLESSFQKSQDFQNASKPPLIFSLYKMLEGLGFDWHFSFTEKKGLKRQVDLQYKYSIPNKGAVLSIQGIYYFAEHFYVAGTVDILGSDSEGESQERHFLNLFRANDYIGLRAGYVF